jgi:hypothetical protein
MKRELGNDFRIFHAIVAITGLLFKNYFDDMSLDWEYGWKGQCGNLVGEHTDI